MTRYTLRNKNKHTSMAPRMLSKTPRSRKSSSSISHKRMPNKSCYKGIKKRTYVKPTAPPKAVSDSCMPTFKSPRLTKFPERILFITDKNYAHIGDKVTACFKSDGMDARFINAARQTMEDDYVKECFDIDHSDLLAIFYDPGNTRGETKFFTRKIGLPKDVSWCLFRGSSYYRVRNLECEANAVGTMRLGNKKMWRPSKGVSSKFYKMKKANRYFDSLTPLVMCGTECLLPINAKSVFLGQPQPFTMPFNNKKTVNMIGHITTPSTYRNVKKGTDKIQAGFKKIDFMETKIIGLPRVPKATCDKFLRDIGFSVITMTSWNSGLGYVGLESLEASCFTMSLLPKASQLIQSPIVHVGSKKDLVEKVRKYHDDVDEFHRIRRVQYDWGKDHFSYPAISKRFRDIVQNTIDNKWMSVDKKFRGFSD